MEALAGSSVVDFGEIGRVGGKDGLAGRRGLSQSGQGRSLE